MGQPVNARQIEKNKVSNPEECCTQLERGIRVARWIRHSCGWLYVEKKVDKLSPGSLKAWAGRNTHSSRPLLFFSLLHPPSSSFIVDIPPPPSPGSMLYVLSLRVRAPFSSSPPTPYPRLLLFSPCIQPSTTVFLSLLSSTVRLGSRMTSGTLMLPERTPPLAGCTRPTRVRASMAR